MDPQVQQMMELARRQQAPNQQGVDVGACGPSALAGLGQGGFPAGVQGCAPAPGVPAGMLTQDGSVYQECFVPLGIRFGVDANGGIYPAADIGGPATGGAPGFQLFPRNGLFWIFGVKFFTAPGVIEFNSVITGDSDWNHLLGPTDAASWNTIECFCPVNWGCISITNPLRMTARSVDGSTLVQEVNGAAWGIRRSSNGTCGPYGPYYGTPFAGA